MGMFISRHQDPGLIFT